MSDEAHFLIIMSAIYAVRFLNNTVAGIFAVLYILPVAYMLFTRLWSD